MNSDPEPPLGLDGAGPTGSPTWYPLAFIQDLTDEPQRITVQGRGYAVFRGDEGWQALFDQCPHRAARLSDGELRDGRLECLYHGWQFGAGGRCVHIPQLLESQKVPVRAHVESFPVREAQGILWLLDGAKPDAGTDADTNAGVDAAATLPTVDALDEFDCTTIDFMIDLPYAQSFLIENVIDIAHIHVAHHGVRGGGHRDMAAPLEFELSESSAAGFSASFRTVGLEGDGSLRGARVRFKAPNLVHYESLYQDPELCSGLALYSLPLAPNRCRLLYRAYSNFPRRRDRLRPRWVEHWTQCTILEQDMDVVQGQAEEMLASQKPPRKMWLPLKSSDALVIAYRKWIDSHGPDHEIGFSKTSSLPLTGGALEPFDRLPMHTQICSSCSRVHARLLAARTPLVVLAFVALAVAAGAGALTGDDGLAQAPTLQLASLLVALGAGAGRLLVDRLERKFRGRG